MILIIIFDWTKPSASLSDLLTLLDCRNNTTAFFAMIAEALPSLNNFISVSKVLRNIGDDLSNQSVSGLVKYFQTVDHGQALGRAAVCLSASCSLLHVCCFRARQCPIFKSCMTTMTCQHQRKQRPQLPVCCRCIVTALLQHCAKNTGE